MYVKTEHLINYYCLSQFTSSWGLFIITPMLSYLTNVPEAKEQSHSSKTPKCNIRLTQTVRLPARNLAAMPVETDGKEGTLLLEPVSRLVGIIIY